MISRLSASNSKITQPNYKKRKSRFADGFFFWQKPAQMLILKYAKQNRSFQTDARIRPVEYDGHVRSGKGIGKGGTIR